MSYEAWKLLHLMGLVLLLGNVTVTSIWKLYADRTGDTKIIAFSQRLVTVTDWFFTFWGIVLLLAGGFGAAWEIGLDPFGTRWLVSAELQFVAAGAIWLGILVPIQVRQARLARDFVPGGEVPEAYRRLSRRWIIWGLIATLPLIGASWEMIAKR